MAAVFMLLVMSLMAWTLVRFIIYQPDHWYWCADAEHGDAHIYHHCATWPKIDRGFGDHISVSSVAFHTWCVVGGSSARLILISTITMVSNYYYYYCYSPSHPLLPYVTKYNIAWTMLTENLYLHHKIVISVSFKISISNKT